MLSIEAMGLALGAALVVAVLALAWLGLRGGAFWQREPAWFVCPLHRVPVSCSLWQNLRTGQRHQVLACSAFARPTKVGCGQECVRLMNLGFLAPRNGAGEPVLQGANGPQSTVLE